jgi:putative peptide zinc metalloprotease protein
MSQLLSTIDRPIGMRLRADLLAQAVESSGTTTWIVNDPLTLEHFQFSAEEFALMDWLRQPVTIAELQRLFNRKFSPQTITPQAIWDFLSRLHSAGLLIGDAAGQGTELLLRRDRERLRRLAFSWTGILGIRFRGIDPDRFLTAVHNEFRWLCSPLTLIAALGFVLYALSLVLGHSDEFRSRLPELSALADPRNLICLLLAIGGVKVLHEFGHALVCKHFGGEVHEMGFMLLVFSPCLYCDVSDAWRFPSKWRRIAVSAAGISVELVLASLATIIWWYAVPGVVQLVALNIMIICTVNTLLVNGNPLMRYDGYFIFSDLVETPNLWQRSREAFRYFWSEWLLGQPVADDPLLPAHKRPWLAAYAVCSKTYLTLVCIGIIWGLAKMLSPHHMQNVAYAIGLTVLGGALVNPISSAVQLARNPIRRAELRTGRLGFITALCLALIVAALAIPIDYKVRAPFVLMPDNASRVYAAIGGTLTKILPAGSKVKRGDVIGQLTNTETELELAHLEGELKVRQLHIEHLERLRGVDSKANDEIPTAQTALADSQRRLDERRSEAKRLTLTAPADGIIIPAPRLPAPARGGAGGGASGGTRLAKWSGSLLDPNTLGAHVAPGTLVCLVGDPARLTAVLLVDDADVKRLAPGQETRLRIDELRGQIIDGELIDVARHELDNTEDRKVARADLSPLLVGLVAPGRNGALYEARVRFHPLPPGEGRGEGALNSPLPAPRSSLLIGGRGEAKVTAERITVGRQIYRYLAQTFRLPM